MFQSDQLTVKRVGDRDWMLMDPLVYEGERDTFRVHAGYVTDFASVPRMLQWFAPSTGKYTLAAVLHDYLCDSLNDYGFTWTQNRSAGDLPEYVSSRDVDGLFRRVMREQRVPIVLRWLMWTGVRWGAVFNRTRRPGVLRDMPLVFLLTLLALPLVAPAVVCIWVAYLLQFVLEGAVGFFTEPFIRE